MPLVATDLDGCFGKIPKGLPGPPTLCISGRTWAEYDEQARLVASKMPLYIRGTGEYGNRGQAAWFKVKMLRILEVTHFIEDDPLQAETIKLNIPQLTIVRPAGR